jgi:acyl transferase domain-containing protein
MRRPKEEAREKYPVHPVMLDAALQAMMAMVKGTEDPRAMWVPVEMEKLQLWAGGGEPEWVHVQGPEPGAESLEAEARLADAQGRVVAKMQGVRMRRTQAQEVRKEKRAQRQPVLYQLAWKPGAEAARARQRPGRWVVVAEAGQEQARRLAERMGSQEVVTPEGLEKSVGSFGPEAWVVWMWEAAGGQEVGEEAIGKAKAALEGLKKLLRYPGTRLWWVTQGAVEVLPKEPVDPRTATLWGLGRSLRKEHPELGCTLVDVEAGEQGLRGLEKELNGEPDEPEVAWRGGRRYRARLVRGEPESRREGRAQSLPAMRGPVLISGGLGALGLQVARWLAMRGVGPLLLMGRRGLETPGAAKEVAKLQEQGAQVQVMAVDVQEADGVKEELKRMGMQTLRGVVHAAGVLDDGLLEGQSGPRMDQVMGPKVRGAWNLHRQTQGMELDFFVMFGSVAGLLGAEGQGSYAGANTFLDALAAHRRSQGLPGQSLAWGPWAKQWRRLVLGRRLWRFRQPVYHPHRLYGAATGLLRHHVEQHGYQSQPDCQQRRVRRSAPAHRTGSGTHPHRVPRHTGIEQRPRRLRTDGRLPDAGHPRCQR